MSTLQLNPKGKTELILSAILYEIIGSSLSTLLLILFTHRDFQGTFIMSIIISGIALFWNMIFNYLFDLYLIKKQGHIAKSKFDRLLHGLGFELVFAILSLSFIMYYLQVGFVEALYIEAFFLIFFLIYTVIYTYIYDMIRAQILIRRQQQKD